MMRWSAACVVLAVIVSAAAAAAQTCPPGVPVVQCFADPCRVRSKPCPQGTTCRSNYCGGCNSDCVPNAAPSKPAGTPASAPAARTTCPDGKLRKCPGCNKMCRRGSTCSVDPCTCQSSCKPVAAPKAPKPCTRKGCALLLCRKDTVCEVDSETCNAKCVPKPKPASAKPKPASPKPKQASPKPASKPAQAAAAALSPPSDQCINAPGSCAVARCIAGTTCMEDAQCRANCVPDTPASAKPASQPMPAAAVALSPPRDKCINAPGSCAVARCIAGTTCMEDGQCRANCVPDTPAPAADKCANSLGCAATTCLTGTECKVDPNTCQAKCVPPGTKA